MKKTKKQSEPSQKQEAVTKKEYEELKDLLQRTHADFQNFRNRTENEKSQFIKLANESLIKKLIPVLDNIELALSHNKEKTEFSQGIESIYDQLLEILNHEGLQKILATGKFNPELHEAIMVEETEKEDGTILQELQKGYVLNKRIIRHSKVKISKKTKWR